jgi:hypothetical protein
LTEFEELVEELASLTDGLTQRAGIPSEELNALAEAHIRVLEAEDGPTP